MFPLELLKENFLRCHPLLQTIRNTTWITASQDRRSKGKKKNQEKKEDTISQFLISKGQSCWWSRLGKSEEPHNLTEN